MKRRRKRKKKKKGGIELRSLPVLEKKPTKVIATAATMPTTKS